MKAMPRRQFIRKTATAALAAPFISTAATRALAQAAEKKIGIAVCGLGSLATNQIAPAFQRTRNCRLAGIITGTPAKAQKWKAQYNIPEKSTYNYDTMDQMAGNPDIDAVYVVTPNALHAEHAIKAAKAGKHVLSEKPMEATVEKAQAMIDACKTANRLLAVGYRCHFDTNNIECLRLAREKTFGDLKIIEACFDIPLSNDLTQWRLKQALAGGGALMDVGIYALQASRYLTGEEPVLVSALETKTNPAKFKEVDETVTWQAKFPSGVIAYCSTSYNSSLMSRYTAIAQNGWFEFEPELPLQRQSRPAQRRPGNKTPRGGSVCRRDGRFCAVHPREQAQQSLRRRRIARHENPDGDLPIHQNGPQRQPGMNFRRMFWSAGACSRFHERRQAAALHRVSVFRSAGCRFVRSV